MRDSWNEQVHSTLNTNYAQTVRISKRMLNAQLQMWLGAEMAVPVPTTWSGVRYKLPSKVLVLIYFCFFFVGVCFDRNLAASKAVRRARAIVEAIFAAVVADILNWLANRFGKHLSHFIEEAQHFGPSL